MTASASGIDPHISPAAAAFQVGRTTFSIANDVAKYFAIIPAAFATTYPALKALDIMRLETPQSAILSAVIFNALNHYRPDSAGAGRRALFLGCGSRSTGNRKP